MRYIFIVNGSKDKAAILSCLKEQLSELDLDYEIYVTTGIGDGTLFVRMYCEFHSEKDCCFVACGGSGTANEVASALLASGSSCPMAIMQFGTTNDLLKCFPGRNFKSVKEMLKGKPVAVDAIKCNENYALNTVNIGFDSKVAYEANINIEEGRRNPYGKGVLRALLLGRFNRLKICVDGRKVSSFLTLSCVIGNGQYCGGMFHCTPKARLDDGLLDVCILRSLLFVGFLLVMPLYKRGEHHDKRWFDHIGKYIQGRHVTISSGKRLSYVSFDGELDVGTEFNIDVLEKAVTLILPPKNN